MNKKLLLLLSATALLITACGNSGAIFTSSNVESISSSVKESAAESSSKEAVKRDFLDDVKNIATNQNYHAEAYYCAVNASDEFKDYGVLEQYNEKAVYWIEGDSGIGVLNNGSLGLFEYTLSSTGDVQLGSFVNFSGGYSVGDYFETPYPLFQESYWSKSTSGDYFECTNSEAISYFAGLTGITAMAEKYSSKYTCNLLKGTYDEDGTMILTMNAFKNDALVCIGKLALNGINSTHNSKIEEYVKTEHSVANPTDWTANQLKEIKEFFGGENAANLPFPAGASYALKVQGLEDYGECIINDVACGDISTSYVNQLKAEGFTAVDTDSYYYCSKVETKNNYKYTYEVYVTYYSQSDIKSSYGADTAAFYPKGRFQIECLSSKSTNTASKDGSLAEFESWMDEHISYAFPKTGWTNVKSVNYIDRTDTYNAAYASQGIRYESVTSVKFYIENEADCRANFESYTAKLIALGFTKEEQKEGTQTYYYFIKGKAEVDFCIYSNNGTYGGFLQAMYWIEE